MKGKRQQEILRIIEEQDIDTQDQLLAELRARGLQSTQATISRGHQRAASDQGAYRLRDLPLRGVRAQGVAECRQPAAHDFSRRGSCSFDLPRTSLCSRPCREWHRRPAQPLTAWRSQDWWAVLLGDDTAMLVMRTNEDAQEFCNEIHTMLK